MKWIVIAGGVGMLLIAASTHPEPGSPAATRLTARDLANVRGGIICYEFVEFATCPANSHAAGTCMNNAGCNPFTHKCQAGPFDDGHHATYNTGCVTGSQGWKLCGFIDPYPCNYRRECKKDCVMVGGMWVCENGALVDEDLVRHYVPSQLECSTQP